MSKNDKIVYGYRPIKELLQSNAFVKKVWIAQDKEDSKFEDIKKECHEKNIPYQEKSNRFLSQLSKGELHQGIVASYIPKERELCFEVNPPRNKWFLCLYLDRIQDPHNFGAIVRSAEFFGVDQIFYPEYSNAPFNSVAVKASSGAAIHNPPYKVTSITSFFKKVTDNGFQIIGTNPEKGKNAELINYCKNTLIIIGNEGEGISPKVQQFCTETVYIPRGIGKIASLNASVSAGILLYQVLLSRS